MSGQPSKTGVWISAAMHAGLLGFLVFGIAYAPKFDDAAESIPVDTVTQTQFNQIMKGELDGKPMKEAPPTPAPKPAAEAPPPPPPPPELKTADAPPPKPPEAAPPKPPDAAPPKAEPTPPPKLTADDAPAPPVRPKEPPPPRPKPEAFKPDALAKMIEKTKDEPPPKLQKSQYDPNAIAKLIGETKTANADPAPTAPRGLPNQNAPRMSPSVSAALDAWLTDAYLNCWTPPPTMPQGDRYVAQVQVEFNADGSLAGTPVLLNPPSDPAWRAHAESAVRAVMKCNPLRVPAEYAPYFDQWRTKTVHFDPTSALG